MGHAKHIVPAVAACMLAHIGGASAQTSATKPDIVLPATCELSLKAEVVTSLKALPAVAAELKRLKIDVADTGEPFVPYDVVDSSRPLPHRQFLRGYVFADRTIIWYYSGGLVTRVIAVELRKMRDTFEKEPVLRVTGATLTGPPCAATQALLDGVRGGGW